MGQGFVIETINFFNSRKPSFPSPFSRQSQKREYLGCLNALWKTDGIDSVDVNDVLMQKHQRYSEGIPQKALPTPSEKQALIPKFPPPLAGEG